MMIARRITEKLNPRQMDDLPEVFCGGWVGYFSYNSISNIEKKLNFSRAPVGDRNFSDAYLGLYDDVLVFDHIEKFDRFPSTEEALDNGSDRLKSLSSKVYDKVNYQLEKLGEVGLDAHKRRSKLELLSRDSETYKVILLGLTRAKTLIKSAFLLCLKKECLFNYNRF